MNRQRVDSLVAAWLDGEHTMLDALHDEPEAAWAAILELAKRDLSPDDTAILAAGPVETLLALHSSAFIDRYEQEAATNPRFRYILGGVWRHGMPDDVWGRLQAARKEVW